MTSIARPKYKDTLLHRNGKTRDIVSALLAEVPGVEADTSKFARQFTPDYNGMRSLYLWVRANVHYQEDPDGVQWIRRPARLVADGEGDCKSFTLFIVSVLKNLGVDYIIRFTNTERPGSKIVNHVYPIAVIDGEEVIVDAVYKHFDAEHPYYYKQDFPMAAIYRLSGVGSTDQAIEQIVEAAASIPDTVLDNDITAMTQGQFARYMNAQYYQNLADGAASDQQRARYATAAQAFRQGSAIRGVGALAPADQQKINKILAVTSRQTDRAFAPPVVVLPDGAPGVSGPLDRLADVIKNAWRKIVNWVFKVALPMASPFLIYAFIKRNIGPKTDAKANKAKAIIAWIQKTGAFETADAVFSAVKVGIAEKFGEPVEKVLARMAGGQSIAGDGSVGAVVAIITAVASALPVLLELIGKIKAVFKKTDAPGIAASDAPNPDEMAQEVAAITPKPIPGAGPIPKPNPAQKEDNTLMIGGAVALLGLGLYFMNR